MALKPQSDRSSASSSRATSAKETAPTLARSPYPSYRVLPKPSDVVREAKRMEQLLKRMILSPEAIAPDVLFGRHPMLKHLNNFGTQIVIRMSRSCDRFQGFKIDFDAHVLKPHVLFLAGTLCDDFNHLHTSPLNGVRALDIGCGALSAYGGDPETSDLLAQFYHDHPPILPEILQMLGAHTIGLDPRHNDPSQYSYQPIYKHKTSDFTDIHDWLSRLSANQKFDLISCFNLFSRQSFAFHYHSPEQIIEFFKGIRRGISPEGLLYTSAPLLPSSSEYRRTNRKIFAKAGFKIIYEGYYFILEPMRSRSSGTKSSGTKSASSKSSKSKSASTKSSQSRHAPPEDRPPNADP